MATIFDMKKCTFRLCDGRRATRTSGTSNSALTLTDKSRHRGTRTPIRFAIVVAGNNTPLSVSLSGFDITINSATDGGGLATSTPNTIKTALEANAPISALVSVTVGGTGNGVIVADAMTALANGARTLEFNVGDGNLTFEETKNREYRPDRGVLEDVRDGDEEPLSLSFAFNWDKIIGVVSSGIPQPRDVLWFQGEAATWESTSNDQCEPKCIDIEVEHNPGCSTQKEFWMFEMFRFESLDADPRRGSLESSGRCNVTEMKPYRQAA